MENVTIVKSIDITLEKCSPPNVIITAIGQISGHWVDGHLVRREDLNPRIFSLDFKATNIPKELGLGVINLPIDIISSPYYISAEVIGSLGPDRNIRIDVYGKDDQFISREFSV